MVLVQFFPIITTRTFQRLQWPLEAKPSKMTTIDQYQKLFLTLPDALGIKKSLWFGFGSIFPYNYYWNLSEASVASRGQTKQNNHHSSIPEIVLGPS